jgi:hypothetical protein
MHNLRYQSETRHTAHQAQGGCCSAHASGTATHTEFTRNTLLYWWCTLLPKSPGF